MRNDSKESKFVLGGLTSSSEQLIDIPHGRIFRRCHLGEGIGQLVSLKTLWLDGTPGLRSLPAGLWTLNTLEVLYLGNCGLQSLPGRAAIAPKVAAGLPT